MTRLTKIFNSEFLLAALLIAIGVAGRLLPHLWNATPIIAVSIIAGKYLGRKYSLIIPVVAMLVSDIFIGFYSWPIMLSVYGSFILAGLIGYLGRKECGVPTLALLAVSGSFIFFLVTNGAVWLFGTMYPHDLSGLFMSYVAGLPFFRNMIMGDIVYTLGLVYAIEYVIKIRKPYANLSLAQR